ncbi:MAG: hypothetical protein Q9220_004371 [cf. Caloplaca sp. 1 TL-2023]
MSDVSMSRSSLACFHSSARSDKHADRTRSRGRNSHGATESPEAGFRLRGVGSTIKTNAPFTRLDVASWKEAEDTKESPPKGHLPHLSSASEVHQISVGHKIPTQRTAVAVGCVSFAHPGLEAQIKHHDMRKGDVLAVARVAGIMAAKNTSQLIPLAHNNVAIEGCSVELNLVGSTSTPLASRNANRRVASDILKTNLQMGIRPHGGVRILVSCESTGKTGVEMEAMSGVMGAALTIVDMCKGMDKEISVRGVCIIGKRGGKSGDWGIFARGSKRIDEDTTSIP